MKIKITRSEIDVIDRVRMLILCAFKAFEVFPWSPSIVDMELVSRDLRVSPQNFEYIHTQFKVDGRLNACGAIIKFELEFTLKKRNGTNEYQSDENPFSLAIFMERIITVTYDSRYKFINKIAAREFLSMIDHRIEEERARRALG